MFFKSLMPMEIQGLIQNHYQVLGTIEFKQFDHDWQNLRNFFLATKKSVFDAKDRYVVEHQDTDIYIREMSVGVNLRNFFQIVRELDIPMYTIMLWTNHFGIQREIDIICDNCHPHDRPTIIESFCANRHVDDDYDDIEIHEDAISHHALSMMNSNRSHRFALYNALKNIDIKKLAMAIKGAPT